MTRRALALAAALALVARAAAAGASAPAPASRRARRRQPGREQALAARLDREGPLVPLTCAAWTRASGADGEPVFRCNVNFGEPHIEGYCVVVRDGRAVTQVEDRALRCRRTRTGDEP